MAWGTSAGMVSLPSDMNCPPSIHCFQLLSLSRGLVATFQAFQKGLGPFYATRFLLGYTFSPPYPHRLAFCCFLPHGLVLSLMMYRVDLIVNGHK